MSILGETTMSVLASIPPLTSTTAKITIGVFIIIASIAYMIHLPSPMCLTRVLVAAIKQAEETYLEVIDVGVFPKSDSHTAETLSSAHPPDQGVAYPRSDPPQLPLNPPVIARIFQGPGVHCPQLHRRDSPALGAVTRAVSLRQRHTHSSDLKAANATFSYNISQSSTAAEHHWTLDVAHVLKLCRDPTCALCAKMMSAPAEEAEPGNPAG
ncbi:hypothetical protein C8R44DRAFT_738643 [Mycena epipterygia]|nr:hypothetical protein C8R44DRAFT_738643 [Mycena epipterygia]